jgi:hypothetical protein
LSALLGTAALPLAVNLGTAALPLAVLQFFHAFMALRK